MPVRRMDNVGIVVEHLDRAIGFVLELRLESKGEHPWKTTGQAT